MTDLQTCIIVGVGRSGTTLLMSMLNAHPRIATPPETFFVHQHLVAAPRATLDQAARRLRACEKFQRLELDLDHLLQPFREGDMRFSMAELYRRMLQAYADREGVQVVGDKMPKYVEYLPVLKHVLPETRILHMIRDPRDVYLSRKKAQWSASQPAWAHQLAYRAQYQLGRRVGPKLFGDRYHELLYEKLITNAEAELRTVCQLIGVDFDSQMLSFSKSAGKIVAPDERDWKKEVTGPLLSQNMHKWRKEMTPRQVAHLEAACWPAFADGTYQRSEDSPQRLGFRGAITNIYVGALSWLYRARLWQINRQACGAIAST